MPSWSEQKVLRAMNAIGSRPELPISRDRLQRALFKARHEMPSAGLGATRRRRLGQSLEYREHREYVAVTTFATSIGRSARYRVPSDRLVRALKRRNNILVVARHVLAMLAVFE